MPLRAAFDALSETIDRYESRGLSVRGVETRTVSAAVETLHVVLEVPVPFRTDDRADDGDTPTVVPEAATLTEDGRITVEFAPVDLVPQPSTGAVRDVEYDVRVVDGELLSTVEFDIVHGEAAFEGARSRDAASSRGDDDTDEPSSTDSDGRRGDGLQARLDAARSEDVPPYDDTPYLHELYDSCDTFAEMSDRIPMDVAAETVRRYMIEAGIHDPSTYDTAGAGTDESNTASHSGDEADSESTADAHPGTGPDAQSQGDPEPGADPDAEPNQTGADAIGDEQLIADGIGLPEGVFVGDVVGAVTDSTTVYEVQRSLGLESSETYDLLRRLNLLDLLLHRVDRPQQSVTQSDVVRRIQQCTADDASVSI
jgi:hypothetical protein